MTERKMIESMKDCIKKCNYLRGVVSKRRAHWLEERIALSYEERIINSLERRLKKKN